MPARKGGGAPTLEEAEAQDTEVESERYRVRRLRDDLTSLKGHVSAATIELVRDRMALMKSSTPEAADADAALGDVPPTATTDPDQGKDRPRTAPELSLIHI